MARGTESFASVVPTISWISFHSVRIVILCWDRLHVLSPSGFNHLFTYKALKHLGL